MKNRIVPRALFSCTRRKKRNEWPSSDIFGHKEVLFFFFKNLDSLCSFVPEYNAKVPLFPKSIFKMLDSKSFFFGGGGGAGWQERARRSSLLSRVYAGRKFHTHLQVDEMPPTYLSI